MPNNNCHGALKLLPKLPPLFCAFLESTAGPIHRLPVWLGGLRQVATTEPSREQRLQSKVWGGQRFSLGSMLAFGDM